MPPRVAYRHTHWIAASAGVDPDGLAIFDINTISVGGWMASVEWEEQFLPWLLKQVEPKASGDWWPTHLLELTPSQCEIVARRLEQGMLFT